MELQALNSLPGAVLLVDAAGSILFANGAFRALVGYSDEDPCAKVFEQVFHKSSRPKIKQIWSLLENRSNAICETGVFLRRRSGRKCEVDLNMKWVVQGGNEVLVVTFHNLTDLRRAQHEREVALRDIHRLSKLAELGKLSAGIAHELNNPLMIIHGFAESLLHELQSGLWDPLHIEEQAQRILQASDRMSKIITNMMKMARQEEPPFRETDLIDVVHESLTLLHDRLQDGQVELQILNKISDARVSCEPGLIGQILTNMVQNALHALAKIEGPRKIKIEIRRSDESGAHLQLAVWNNGVPIPERLKGHIMTPFFSTKPVAQGVGLGLAISQSIMDQHGGKLFFTSSEKEGTEFVLDFPAAASGEIQQKKKTSGSKAA